MAWNNGFPASYQQMMPQNYPYGQQPFQQPQQPMITPPTIRAEIVQIEDEAAVHRYPLAAGVSQMFITRAEDKIIIKTMGQTGAMPLRVYEERPPAPPAPVFDPGEYVRKDELKALVSEAIEAQMKQKETPAAKRTARKDEE
jgi:hypothetical protein